MEKRRLGTAILITCTMNLCANKRLKGAAAPSLQTPPDAGEGAAARGAREVPAAPRLLHAPLGGPQLCSAHADETSAPIAGDRPRQHPEGPALQGAPAPQAFLTRRAFPSAAQGRRGDFEGRSGPAPRPPLESDALGAELSPPDTCPAASQCEKQR